MADIKINLVATSNLDQVNKDAKELHKTVTATQKVLTSTPKAMASAKAATDPGMSRGATGVGGGSDAKDFSRQAQGLGGLVHVYATFAANIFAVTAAFTALSKAADYTNMVEGLNQLGAASGKNLGTMAKGIVAVTDGAVSLKSAMEATAQASSAGMSGEQISRMAKLAKTASQALGRDTQDSLNRLSRGISKIEPELLDELGIMVRVDRAADDYARTIGKTASALTDFEKRQAFANAVLKQGEEKFGKINLDANPYSKLQASFQNLLYTGGELVNKVIEPIIKLLGASPVALGTVMAGITSMLLSKSIPALKGWRENIKLAAEESQKLAASKVEKAQVFRVEKTANIQKMAEERANIEAAAHESAMERVERAGKSKGLSKRVKDIINTPARLVTPQDLKYVEDLANSTDKAGKKAQRLRDAYKEAALAIKESQRAEAEFDAARSRNIAELTKKPGMMTAEYQNQVIANRLQRKALSRTAVSNAVEESSAYGLVAGWTKLKEGIAEAEATAKKSENTFGKMAVGITYVKGALGLAATAASRFAAAFGWIGMVVAAAVAAFQLLSSFASKNSKEMESFGESSTTLNEALQGLSRTMDNIASKDPLAMLGSDSIQAKANAINELSNSFTKLVSDLEKADKKANGFDRTVDAFKDLFGAGLKDVSTKDTAAAISNTLNNSLDSIDKSEFKKELQKVLGVTDVTSYSIKEALGELDGPAYIKALQDIDKAQQKFSRSVSNSASRLTEFNTATSDLEKQMQSLLASFTPTDNMAKFGIAQMQQAMKLTEALKDPEKALAALAETAGDFSKLKLLPPDVATQLASYNNQLSQLKSTIGTIDLSITAGQSNLDKLTEDSKGVTGGYARAKAKRDIAVEEARLESLKKQRVEEYKKVEVISVKFDSAAEQMYEHGAAALLDSLKRGGEMAAISINKGLIAGMTGPGSAEANKIVQLQEIAVQEKILQSQAALIISQEELKLAIEEQTLEEKWTRDGKLSEVDSKRYDNIANLRNILSKPLSEISKAIDKLPAGSGRGSMLATRGALAGMEAQQQKLNADKTNAINAAELAKFDEEAEKKKLILQLDISKSKQQEDYLNLLTKSNDIYIESLELSKEKAIKDRELKELAQEQANLDALKAKAGYREKNLSTPELRALAEKAGNHAIIKQLDLIDNKKAQNHIAEINRIEARKDKEYNAYKFIRDLEDKKQVAKENYAKEAIGAGKSITANKREVGLITEGESIKANALADTSAAIIEQEAAQRQLARSYEDAMHTKTRDIGIQKGILEGLKEGSDEYNKVDASIKSTQKAIDDLNDAQKVEVEYLKKSSELKIGMIKIQSDYQAALVLTEETMKKMEASGSFGSQYFGALADDFNNKLTQMIKAAKSAGSVFTEGLIGAVDSTIDKFFDLIQKSELTWKTMQVQIRNSLSDVFKDTASQMLKNTWKTALKSIIGPSQQEKAAAEAEKKMTALVSASERTAAATESMAGISKVPEEYYPDPGEPSAAADTQKAAADTFAGTAKQFATDFTAVISGQKSVVDLFGNLVKNLGSTLFSALSSLTSSSASGTSSAMSSVGGWISSLFGGGGQSAEELAHAATLAATYMAKGGAFQGSASLSSYSNSIVSKPTMFAFAQGGIMGEAGPEAILPLKRDPMGNLGVTSSGAGGNTNNIEINISIDSKGTATSETKGSTEQTASQLGTLIKSVVSQELIKQSRPGGLLAR